MNKNNLRAVTRSRQKPLSYMVRAVIAGSFLAATQAHALNWELENGVLIDLDTTIAYNTAWRLKDQDPTILAGGGNGVLALVTDDGNRNFDQHDMTQNQINFSSDLDIQVGDGGAFFRARGWYDEVYDDNDLAKADFQQNGIDQHKSEIELLDAFVHNTFYLGDRTLSLRLGEQVVSWGESLFIGGGVSSAQSPVDATKANAPGVDLKDIFLPIGQLYGEIDLTDTLSMGAYYQYDWEETRIDSPGTFFNVLDGLGQKSVGDILDIGGLPVAEDTPDEGQWGIALRYTAEELNNTEFGLYYLSYNDFTPGLQLLPPLLGPQLTHEYFEDISLIGLSFGTVVGDTNLSGELTYRDGQPVQLNIPGAFYFSEAETAQAQLSMIHIIGATPVADNLTFFGEIGYNRVLSIDSDATAAAVGVDVNDTSNALDNDRGAASATIRLKADYFNIANGLDLAVTGTYRNDFNGVSSVPFTFTEDVEQLSLKADFTYLNSHSFGVSYVNFLTDPDEIVADTGKLELAHLNADRDYISAYYKYRF